MGYEYMQLPELQFCTIQEAESLDISKNVDCTILVFNDTEQMQGTLSSNAVMGCSIKLLNDFIRADPSAATGGTNLIVSPSVAGNKLIISPTGSLLGDLDDVRRYGDAVSLAIKRAKSISARKLMVILQRPPFGKMDESIKENYSCYYKVAALAALAESYEPLEARETLSELAEKSIQAIKIVLVDEQITSLELSEKKKLVDAIETGRRLAKDIGGADPERMSAVRAAETIKSYFSLVDNVKLSIVDELDIIKKDYPLVAAVARASGHVSRHAPRIVHLEYRSSDQSQVKEDLYMVGKGINYDTGGADLKVGGNMATMSRDKCGAAALAGFVATCALLKPTHVNISVALAFARNSIGSDSYVCDEIIKSRTGVRVRIGNTDAEGRMVMADLLAEQKEKAISAGSLARARIFTCATLTGHVVRAYGPYAACMENGPARLLAIGDRLKQSGQIIGDCFEISTLRREDKDMVQPTSNCDDIIQANRAPSTMTNRGHQFPAIFLQIVSGLNKHGLEASKDQRLAYTHLDIAGTAEEPGFLHKTTGSPIAALTMAFIKN